jgi:hypothetical protein
MFVYFNFKKMHSGVFMKLYKSDGLSGYQNFHRKVFEAPQGGLAHWGVKKIENFYRNERIVYHPIWAHTARRLIALAMPMNLSN